MKKPIIVVTSSTVDEECSKVLHTYISAIEDSGGVPLLLPYVEKEETLDAYLSLCDGVLFTGGADVSPHLYGEDPHSASGPFQPLRDAVEVSFAHKVLATDKPVMAICRGAQLLNAVLGGTLYQDIPSVLSTDLSHRQSEPKTSPSHGIEIIENTPLFSLIGKACMCGNSFHHQAIKTLGRGLSVMARAADGIVEAVYATDRPYLRAYQWHPERLCRIDGDNRKLFDDFIHTAGRK